MRDTATRRSWLYRGVAAIGSVAGFGAARAQASDVAMPVMPGFAEGLGVSLNGEWRFRVASGAETVEEGLHAASRPTAAWNTARVPHTWQVDPEHAGHYGFAWYTREFDVPAAWKEACIRVEFEAVFHSAWVWVNGKEAGRHLGKGYTAFAFDISSLLRFGERNQIAVRVDNSFREDMLPRGRSSDWAHDGGIYRPVSLLVTPRVYVERVAVEALPDHRMANASIEVTAMVRNAGEEVPALRCRCEVIEEQTGLAVLTWETPATVPFAARSTTPLAMPAATLAGPRLWHFEHPHLYRLRTELLAGDTVLHRHTETFGVRRFEVKDGGFYLNGERIRPMGVERMAGSNPGYGMAEPGEWLEHDHRDLLALNCVFTRVHWPQDRRTLDFCDRQGILMQSEVPTWGPRTFEGMPQQPSAAILENGLEQLREMIARDRNHPCIFAWGLCNEIGGQQPAAYRFAEQMYAEAKKLDPRRPLTYASHSLQKTPGNDVSRIMDFVSCNEYYESWLGGDLDTLRRNLEEIRAAFPGKPIVMSEYGYCACTADRPEGDGRRIQVLRDHTAIFRDFPEIAGLIFFCYNDYRTHVGDRGLGVLQQRVHGVVDVLGNRKPSFAVLREESSPVESLTAKGTAQSLRVRLRTRAVTPCWVLRGYRLQWTAFGYGEFPAEQGEIQIPELRPGAEFTAQIVCRTPEPVKVVLEVLRPTGVSTRTLEWRS